MLKQILIESQCLPPIPSVKSWIDASGLIIESYENYQKRSYRNRVYIAGPNGPQLLTVPLVKGKNQKQLITEVSISYDEDWVQQWLLHIKTAYANAPYFIYYYPSLEHILTQNHNKLWELNNMLLSWITEVISIKINISETISYQSTPPPNQLDHRNTFTPQTVKASDMVAHVRYRQVHEAKNGFIPNLSILDLIMCCGIEAKNCLH